MAALVKGLSGSATFRSPAGSWAMLSRISGGGRRCRVLGRRLSLKHGRCAVRDRTLEDWLDALGVTAAKAKAGIPCPLCGGTDRFHVQRGTRGQAVIGGCRICSKPLYPDIAYAVFGDSDRDSRRPAARPTHSVSRPSDLDAAQRAYARRCWESAEWTPNSPSHPTRRWLWSRQGRDAKGPSLWWAELPPPPVVRYLAAFPAPGYPLDGGKPWIPQGPALVTLLAPPSAWIAAWPGIPDVHAVQLIPLDSEGRPRMNDGAKIAKRTLGASGGCCLVVGNPAPNSEGLIVVEGLADGLALAARREQTLMVTCTTPPASGPVLDYAATWAAVQLHGDKDGPGQVAAAKLKGALLARGVSVESLIFDGFKDAAAYAEAGNEPLADLSGAYADDVAAMSADLQSEGLPKHEAQRRAALCCIAPDAPRTPPVERPRQPAPTDTPVMAEKAAQGPPGAARQGGLAGMPTRSH